MAKGCELEWAKETVSESASVTVTPSARVMDLEKACQLQLVKVTELATACARASVSGSVLRRLPENSCRPEFLAGSVPGRRCGCYRFFR